MPRKVCECCKTILGNAYKFKQICKRSDTLLKMYPMTGNVPPKIEIPQEMLPFKKSEAPINAPRKVETKSVAVGNEQRKMKTVSVQTDPHIATMAMIIDDEEEYESVPIIAPPAQFSTLPKKPILLPTKDEQARGTSVKILNKARTDTPAKQFRRPSQAKIERIEFVKPKILNQLQGQQKKDDTTFFETTSDGNMQILTYDDNEEEYLDENEWEARIKDETMDKSDNAIVYTCNMCERSFPLMQQLEIHKQNHTRERNHPCKSSRMILNELINKFLSLQANVARNPSSRSTISPSTFSHTPSRKTTLASSAPSRSHAQRFSIVTKRSTTIRT